MRNPFLRTAQRVIDACRPGATFDDSFEMIDVAHALRSHGCRVRETQGLLRLHVTVPRPQRARARLALGDGAR